MITSIQVGINRVGFTPPIEKNVYGLILDAAASFGSKPFRALIALPW